MLNFYEFEQLNEGLSSILYHFTHLSNLKNILHENKFQASIIIGSDADKKINKNKFYPKTNLEIYTTDIIKQ